MHLKDAIIHGVGTVSYTGTGEPREVLDGDLNNANRHVFMIKEGFITGTGSEKISRVHTDGNTPILNLAYETTSPASTIVDDLIPLDGLKKYYLPISGNATGTGTATISGYSTLYGTNVTLSGSLSANSASISAITSSTVTATGYISTPGLRSTTDTITFAATGTNAGVTLALTGTGTGVDTSLITIDGHVVYHSGNIPSYLRTDGSNSMAAPITFEEDSDGTDITSILKYNKKATGTNFVRDLFGFSDTDNIVYIGSELEGTESDNGTQIKLRTNKITLDYPVYATNTGFVGNYATTSTNPLNTLTLGIDSTAFTAYYAQKAIILASEGTANDLIVEINSDSNQTYKLTYLNGGLVSISKAADGDKVHISSSLSVGSDLKVTLGKSTLSNLEVKQQASIVTASNVNVANRNYLSNTASPATNSNRGTSGKLYDTLNYPFLTGTGSTNTNGGILSTFGDETFNVQYTAIPSALAVARFVTNYVPSYVSSQLSNINALTYKGSYTGQSSANNSGVTLSGFGDNEPTKGGDVYITTASGYFGNQKIEIGDLIIYKGTDKNVTSNYTIVNKNIDPSTDYVTLTTTLEITGTKTFKATGTTTVTNAFSAGSITTPTLNVSGTGTIATLSSTNATITNLTTTTTATFSGATTAETLNVTGLANFTNIINGDINGNAVTATKLLTARSITVNLAGTGNSVNFDGSANIAINASGTLTTDKGGTGISVANTATLFRPFKSGTGTYAATNVKNMWDYNASTVTDCSSGLVPVPADSTNGYYGSTYFLSATGWTTLNSIFDSLDTKVTQTVKTNNVTYPIVGSNVAVNTSSGTDTVAKFDVLTYNPSTYSLTNGGCTMQYNSTNKCLTFNFS